LAAWFLHQNKFAAVFSTDKKIYHTSACYVNDKQGWAGSVGERQCQVKKGFFSDCCAYRFALWLHDNRSSPLERLFYHKKETLC
jgi:hypothetical protein